MNLLKNLLLIVFFIYSSISSVYCNESLAFINLDEIIKETSYGKKILNEINSSNKKNINKLKQMEDELKLNENELNKKKNIISNDDFEKELVKLKEKIINYREIKNEITKNFEEQKNLNLNNFFSKINPIIQEYMDEKSIDILLRQENIFIGKSTADITSVIIKKINTKLN